MVNASSATALASILPYAGPLFGVVIGAGLTWLLQRNEWGRQRRWELKRDAVLDAVRALADLDAAVREFHVAWSGPPRNLTREAEDALKSKRIEAVTLFSRCSSLYQRAHTVADVAIGGDLSKDISGYFQFALRIVGKMGADRIPLDTDAKKQLAKWHNAVIISAREALGIERAGGLPVLDYDNESPITDH